MRMRRQRLAQCPGCWAYGLILEGRDSECKCGERMTIVDLRGATRYVSLADVGITPIDEHRPRCRCRIWEQQWRPEAPHLCVNCGGLFDPKTVPARENEDEILARARAANSQSGAAHEQAGT